MAIMVWGHRGHRRHRFSANAPYENSLQAYRETLRIAAGLECDIVQSRQGTAYLVHDTLFDGIVHYEMKSQLDEKSGELLGNRFIYQLMDAEIDLLRLKDGQAIPKLEELLAAMKDFPGRVINLELKGPNVVKIAVQEVEKAISKKFIKREQIVFSSFNFPALRDLRNSVEKRFKIAALFTLSELNMSPMYPNWLNAPQDAWYIPFRLEDRVLQRNDIQAIQPDFINVEINSLNFDVIEALETHLPDTRIILWTFGEPDPDKNPVLIDKIREFKSTDRLYAVICDMPDIVQKRLLENGIDVQLP